MDKQRVLTYCRDGMADPLSKPFFDKVFEWDAKNSPVWKELVRMLEAAEDGEFQ